jgi:hypothetical protein
MLFQSIFGAYFCNSNDYVGYNVCGYGYPLTVVNMGMTQRWVMVWMIFTLTVWLCLCVYPLSSLVTLFTKEWEHHLGMILHF